LAQVSLRINGYSYLVGCEDGQERHLEAMGGAVQSRIDSIKALGQTGEARLLVLAALLLADELHDRDAVIPPARPAPPPEPTVDPVFEATVRRLADKAEEIAAALERA
jgi:cell division protein ZapA